MLKKLRETGCLAWLEAAGIVPLSYRHWLAWDEYYQTLNKGRNAYARDLTIAYFSAYYREYGGGEKSFA